MLPSRYWIDLATTDFRIRDMASVIAVLPVAAVEQHGPHLPLGVDAMIMQGAIERVVERLPDDLDALFLPMQSVGVSIEHRNSQFLSDTPEARLLLRSWSGWTERASRSIAPIRSG